MNISKEELKMDKPNTVMLGALAKAAEVIQLKTLQKKVSDHFMHKYHNKTIADGNNNAIQRGHDEVKNG